MPGKSLRKRWEDILKLLNSPGSSSEISWAERIASQKYRDRKNCGKISQSENLLY